MVPWGGKADFARAPDATPLPCAPGPGPTRTVGANKYIGIGPTIGMGRSTTTVVFSACQTVNLPVGDDLLAWTVTGPFTAEAANGDLVYGTFSMSQYASGRLTLDGMAITGGTGRFSGATGSATGEGYVERPALTGWWTFRGTITRPNT